jgi:hypothetical protein
MATGSGEPAKGLASAQLAWRMRSSRNGDWLWRAGESRRINLHKLNPLNAAIVTGYGGPVNVELAWITILAIGAAAMVTGFGVPVTGLGH